jgi:ubiquinone/menaquinone biosynthesis C-methylase UbiE
MQRVRTAELMDHPGIDPAAHAHALRSLNRIDRLTRVHCRLYGCVDRLCGKAAASILDLGSGGGGFLRYVAERRNGNGDGLLLGLDRSPGALALSNEWHGADILGVAADGRQLPFADESVDVVTCSLFLHHFGEADVVRILREAARVARRGIVVGDLSRSRTALVLTWLTTRLVSRSPVFHVDGVRSVRAAFRAPELAELVRQAGLKGARVTRRFPFRLVMLWEKGGCPA